jgi:hypothetical protein
VTDGRLIHRQNQTLVLSWYRAGVCAARFRPLIDFPKFLINFIFVQLKKINNFFLVRITPNAKLNERKVRLAIFNEPN